MSHTSFDLSSTFIVLDNTGDAIPISVSDRFFDHLVDKFGDFQGKRLLSHFTFETDWNSWEMHPAGDEVVYLLSGRVDFILEQLDGEHTMSLNTAGSYGIVPRGTWHTARVHTPSSLLFITPGEGTQHRSC